MRKLNSKNKRLIVLLSIIAIAIFIVVIGFILYKKNILDVKIPVKGNSFTYSADEKLVKIDSDSIIKKDLIGRYYIILDNKNITLGYNAVIYQKNDENIMLLGKYYEVGSNGNINIIDGENKKSIHDSKFYKIADRKYLLISGNIFSDNKTLNTNAYLLVNIDKKGNGHLFNHDINVKTFEELTLITDKYNFNVNEETLKYSDELIYLNKINGSSNEYKKEENNESSESIYNEEEVVVQKEIIEKYIGKKTTITDYVVSDNSVKVSYLIYDPLTEYNKVYAKYDSNGKEFIKELSLDETQVTLDNLVPSTSYNVKFYYDYLDNNEIKTKMFDSINFKTKNILAQISLEKVSENGVTYKVIVDGYELDKLDVLLLIDNEKVGTYSVNTTQAANGGFISSITLPKKGNVIELKLDNAIYNGVSILLDASYKYVL